MRCRVMSAQDKPRERRVRIEVSFSERVAGAGVSGEEGEGGRMAMWCCKADLWARARWKGSGEDIAERWFVWFLWGGLRSAAVGEICSANVLCGGLRSVVVEWRSEESW